MLHTLLYHNQNWGLQAQKIISNQMAAFQVQKNQVILWTIFEELQMKLTLEPFLMSILLSLMADATVAEIW